MWCHWVSALFFLLTLRPSAQSNAEGNVLFTFKQALKDPMHALSSWNYDLVDPCSSWAHIDCDFRHVINVNLGNQMLSGVLPPGIGNLPYLNTLVLEDNFLSGSLPTQLGNLTQLVSLNANNNTLNGSIPDTLGNLSRLQHLTLSHNVLSGQIPASLVNLYNLATIDLSYNNLSGKIPVSLFNIPQFNFVGNHLDCGPGFDNPCQGIKNPTSNRSQASSTNKGAIAGGIIGGGSLLAIIALVLSAKKRRTQPQKDIFVDVVGEDDLKVSFGQLKRFSWRELQLATESFSEKNVLGQGGFGRVYKGTLGDGTQVAVKRLKSNHPHGGDAAFLREVEMISVAVHRNLLQLIGFCITVSERLLVYPYMANGSVANRLRERKPEEAVLDWSTRKHIALGAARGLTYLHDHCNPKIIHRDVKAANVLLDKDFEPVVGDFGLAKLVDVKDTHVTTMVRGTMGHIAPEYLLTGKSSERTDIFGYGIMLLELVTGQRAIDFSRLQDEDDVLLLDHVKKLQHQKRLTSLIDPNLEQYDVQEVEEFVMVALLCTQSTPEERPSMEDVVRMLSGEGLKERWEEWVKEEVIRRHEYEMMPRRLAEWTEDSTFNQQAVELSGAR